MMLSKWDVALINVKEDKCGKTNMSEIKPEPAALQFTFPGINLLVDAYEPNTVRGKKTLIESLTKLPISTMANRGI